MGILRRVVSAMHILSDRHTSSFYDGAEASKDTPPLKDTSDPTKDSEEEYTSEADYATANESCPCCGKQSTAPANEKATPASLQDSLGMAGLPRTGSVEYYEYVCPLTLPNFH